MKFKIVYQGREWNQELNQEVIVIGRPKLNSPPDLDLSPDANVSRRHARIWLHEGAFWIEDSTSRLGTSLNEIPLTQPAELEEGDVIGAGDTRITVVSLEEDRPTVLVELEETAPTVPDPAMAATELAAALPPAMESDIEFSETVNGDAPPEIAVAGRDDDFSRRLGMLLELPLKLSSEPDIDHLLQSVVERVIGVIPGAVRGALVLKEPASSRYLLKAHLPVGRPAISETLTRRTITEGRGFIWRRGEGADPTETMKVLCIETGMYAPMVWHGEIIGVICVDNPGTDGTFTGEDLRFLLAVAHYAAAAVVSRRLQEGLINKTRVLERLLGSYSPTVRQLLLDKAQQGRLRPGGERSEVTILFSDFRGFTLTSSKMDAAEVMDMLNEYFSPLVDIVFSQDGTVDKFIGDAILAVFGSPIPDEHQQLKAVRAAVAMRDAVQRLNEKRTARGEPVCNIGIGIHAGEVLHGFLGSANRLEYTVIGDAVNKASRYCNGAQGGEVLVSKQVFEHVYASVQAEKTVIPTKHEGDFTAYRILSVKMA